MLFGEDGLLNKVFLPGYADAGADTSFQAVAASAEEQRALAEEEESDSVLKQFATNVWIAKGPVVDFFGFPYPTRMVVVKLSDGSAWVWSPIELTDELATVVVDVAGPVKHIVSPNKIHWLFMKSWQERFPEAKLYASPGLAERKIAKDITFDMTLTQEPPADYSRDIDQAIFEGGILDEVVFFHKPSKTVIFCDLIQRHRAEDQKGFKGWIMKADGLVGPSGSTPKELRFAFWVCGLLPKARQSVDKVLQEWEPEKLIIAHGENAPEAATFIIENCLSWIPIEPQGCKCCSPRNG